MPANLPAPFRPAFTLWNSDKEDDRAVAACALGQGGMVIKFDAAIPVFEVLLHDPKESVRSEAILAVDNYLYGPWSLDYERGLRKLKRMLKEIVRSNKGGGDIAFAAERIVQIDKVLKLWSEERKRSRESK